MYIPTYCDDVWEARARATLSVYCFVKKENGAYCRPLYDAAIKDHTKIHTYVIFPIFLIYDFVKLKACEVMFRAFSTTLHANLNT